MVGVEGWQKALEVLEPLDAQIDFALATGDVTSAMRLAFGGAVEAADLVAERPGAAGVHMVYVELRPQPLAALEDGTLAEGRAWVNLEYRRRELAPAEAVLLADGWTSLGQWAVDSP